MRSTLAQFVLATALLAAPAGLVAAATPDFEVLEGSSVTLGVAGAQRTVPLQSVALAPAHEPGFTLRSVARLELPRIDLAFGEYVDVFVNQGFDVDLDSAEARLSFPLWLIDSDGNPVEVPIELTTGVPATTDCSGLPYCLDDPSDPPYCAGRGWDPVAGDLRFVGMAPVPDDSGTTVDCSVVVFILEAAVAGGDGDGDGDGIGDACDNCPGDWNPQQRDRDADGTGNACQPMLVNFQPAAAPVPAGYLVDSGLSFDETRSYGWTSGAPPTRDRGILADQRLDTFAFSSGVTEWEARLPPAPYDVTVTVGDAQYPQGPQLVVAEGRLVLDHVSTAAAENMTAETDDLVPADGRLTVAMGGGGGTTALNYVTAVETAEQPFLGRHVNFQPATSPVPEGYEMDTGAAYDAGAGRGWSANLQSQARDRQQLDDPVLDTLVFSPGVARTFELDLPADYYEVRVSVGDAQFAQGRATVIVEGRTWLENGQTAIAEFLTLTDNVLVLDGSLSVTIGEAGGTTAVNYVSVASLPRDLDGDGVSNLTDNCLDVPNADQADTDGDGEGDMCSVDNDGDGWPDVVDNCAELPNSGQEDADGDGHGDACDCAPADGTAFAEPQEIPVLLHFSNGELIWPEQTLLYGSGTVYDMVSIDLPDLRGSGTFQSAICLSDDGTAPSLMDNRDPTGGNGYGYLVRAQNACAAGTFGQGSANPDARAGLDATAPCP